MKKEQSSASGQLLAQRAEILENPAQQRTDEEHLNTVRGIIADAASSGSLNQLQKELLSGLKRGWACTAKGGLSKGRIRAKRQTLGRIGQML